ncbi:MAG TPA: hypothetical protein VJO33_09360 [Gemmatimonadaceae bacterium]|nr:hypothetical protein [Gemmatimonadaceae bacterium]
MSSGQEKRQRKRATRSQSASQTPGKESGPANTDREHTPSELAAREHFRREKARRAERTRPPEHPLEQARRAYQALLAADAERAKGGRPKKSIAPPTQKPPSSDKSDQDVED